MFNEFVRLAGGSHPMESMNAGLAKCKPIIYMASKADKGKLADVRAEIASSRTEEIKKCMYFEKRFTISHSTISGFVASLFLIHKV